ncbi:hypothetical protein OHC50_04250 [Paenarthrobacter ilicis]|uniref:hypothetical protein n=1 Tax=Paenarthrobacter ilicis TaxID=43665 RepID=UPI0028D789B5|nr:hypothetical protein [Paenarthrobacter ilicis]
MLLSSRAIASAQSKGGNTLNFTSIPAAKIRHSKGKSLVAKIGKPATLVAVGSLLALTTACGQGGTTTSSALTKTNSSTSASPTPTPVKIAGTSCTAERATQVGSGDTFICAKDQTGKLVWLDSVTARKLSDQRASEAAAKAAADKAAADKAVADKAIADKAAADKLAAEQAAAAKAAAEKAAADKEAAALVAPKAVPAAPPAQSGCDPNYAGACVPIASDVDCAGGKGNGPAYVRGPVTVIGSDIYKLDSDGDGIGCEK